MYPNFINHICKYVEIDDESIAFLIKYITPLKLKRKEFLLKENQVCQSIYFVEKGCLRMYFIDNKLNEQITQFALEHWWMADHFSFIDHKPSPYFIQTVEKSEILAISSSSFETMLREIPQMERYFRMVMQRGFSCLSAPSKIHVRNVKRGILPTLFQLFSRICSACPAIYDCFLPGTHPTIM